MQAGEKFLFDIDFDDLEILKEITEQEQGKEEDHGGQDAETEDEVITFTEEEMNSQRQQAREEGRKQGITETLEGIENTIALLFAKIEETLTGLRAIQIEENGRIHKEAIAVASAMVEKLFSNLDKEHGFEEVIKLTENTLEGLLREPSIIIHVDAAYADIMDEHLKEYLGRRDFQGKIVVTGDTNMAAGDCCIEWATGSAERSSSVTLEAAKEVVEQNLNATPPASPMISAASEPIQAVSEVPEPHPEMDNQKTPAEDAGRNGIMDAPTGPSAPQNAITPSEPTANDVELTYAEQPGVLEFGEAETRAVGPENGVDVTNTLTAQMVETQLEDGLTEPELPAQDAPSADGKNSSD